jgi:hypothetical protein
LKSTVIISYIYIISAVVPLYHSIAFSTLRFGFFVRARKGSEIEIEPKIEVPPGFLGSQTAFPSAGFFTGEN